jgi:hypothetical protein
MKMTVIGSGCVGVVSGACLDAVVRRNVAAGRWAQPLAPNGCGPYPLRMRKEAVCK